MFYKIYSHISLTKCIINYFFKLNSKSAYALLKSIDKRDFKNPELFYINFNDGVMFEFLMQKN
jgi:hypothetical protein